MITNAGGALNQQDKPRVTAPSLQTLSSLISASRKESGSEGGGGKHVDSSSCCVGTRIRAPNQVRAQSPTFLIGNGTRGSSCDSLCQAGVIVLTLPMRIFLTLEDSNSRSTTTSLKHYQAVYER
jgi:hypothetical protein